VLEKTQEGAVAVHSKTLCQGLNDSGRRAQKLTALNGDDAVHGGRQEAQPFDHRADLALGGNRHNEAEAQSDGAPESQRPDSAIDADDHENRVVGVYVDPEERSFRPAGVAREDFPVSEPLLHA
jgi:hypothetical protein